MRDFKRIQFSRTLLILILLINSFTWIACSPENKVEESGNTAILSFNALLNVYEVSFSKQSLEELPHCSESQPAYFKIVLTGPKNFGSHSEPYKLSYNAESHKTIKINIPEGQYELKYLAVYNEEDILIWLAPNENDFSFEYLPKEINFLAKELTVIDVPVVCLKNAESPDGSKSYKIGFNMRWRNTPELTEKLYTYIDRLRPDLLRYPGGTLVHKWNWKTGLPEPSNSSDYVHLIEDVKKLSDNTNSGIIFVMDIVNSSVEDQIEMMKAANVPVNYVEIGNELYADDYESIFPDGKAYADTVNNWVPKIRAEFPDAKFGTVMIGRNAGKDRKNNWNTMVDANILVDVDAYIYHIYSNGTETISDRIVRFEDAYLENTGKDLWITEYGARSGTLSETDELADYVESIADIALNHVLTSRSGNFAKLSEDIEYTLKAYCS